MTLAVPVFIACANFTFACWRSAVREVFAFACSTPARLFRRAFARGVAARLLAPPAIARPSPCREVVDAGQYGVGANWRTVDGFAIGVCRR